ncbi:MAG: T9SS type A sorting domain-containing protein [Paludibacter sp.]|nr:T9SS type A sorting domain-containing protein [Paludibacter sp.]
MSTKLRNLLNVIFIVGLFPLQTFAQTIEITTEAQLRAMADNLTADYKLVNDITLTSSWIPIGDEQNRFTGTFDGNGKTISGLHFSDTSRNGAGFIGVADGAFIENLSVVNAFVYGGQDVAGIVGRAYAPTTIQKCYTSGSFIGYDHVGGIAGGTKSSGSDGDINIITDCYSTAIIKSTGWQSGGIIGTTINAEISNTYFAGGVSCSSGRTAGIAALADGGTTKIQNSVSIASYLKGDETNRVLGSANGNTATLLNNYSWEGTQVYVKGELYTNGESNSSGVDGEHTDLSTLKSANFYNTTLGWSSSVWTTEDGKYPIFNTQTYPIDGDGIYFDAFPERALPGTTHNTNVVSALGRTVSCASSNPSVATISSDGLVSFLANGTTTLTFTTTGDDYSSGATATYDLTVEGISYTISTEQDLRNIKYDLNGEFTLANNITLTQDWIPLGTFKGKLNGNGKIIYGLRVDNSSVAQRGLFSNTEGAEITKLGIEDAYLVGNEDIGAIVGNMKGGLLDQCYVANSYISGRDHVGSLVGAMRGYDVVVVEADPDNGVAEVKETRYATVSNSYSGAQVYSREYQAGGLAGIICGGTIEKCYFSGVVEAVKGRAAGVVSLIDSNDAGNIKNNLNLTVGGYCGENTYRIGDWGGRSPESSNYVVKFTNNWSKEHSYFGTNAANSAVQDGQKDDNRNGATLSDDNKALSQIFYTETLGWDFTNTWKFISGTEGKLYPVLAWQSTPLVSKIYGIPANPYLTWYQNSMDAIDLNKIIASTGQTLVYSIASGSNLADLDGMLLYVTENNLTQGGVATIEINSDASLSSVISTDKSSFEVEVILRDAFTNISTVEDFLGINQKLYGKFMLTNNIDLSGVDFEGLGSSSAPFTGVFNGNGYTVSNAVIKTGGNNIKGFFNATNGATIQKLGVANIQFNGLSTNKGDNIGGLVGSCQNTTIEECYVTGTITGNDHVGGFIGGNSDNVDVRNCYANVTISAGQQVGGFFGVTAGSVSVENSYFTGTLAATSRGWSGGFIGLIDKSGTIELSGCVSIGDISSVEVAGYHIAGNMTDNGVERGIVSSFVNNLYNIDAVLNTNGNQWVLPALVTGITESATPMLPANLKKQVTYTNIGWDFTNVWNIEENVAYPTLKNVSPAPTSVKTITFKDQKYSAYCKDNAIYVQGILEKAQIIVYNTNGQMVSISNVTSNNGIPVRSKGLYLLKITENGITSTVKVIYR